MGGTLAGAGEAALRCEAKGLRWADEASFPQKGEDNKEDLAQAAVQQMQAGEAREHPPLQAFRAGGAGSQEEQGPDLVRSAFAQGSTLNSQDAPYPAPVK